MDVLELFAQVLLEESHKRFDLEWWTLPVFDREGVEGEDIYAQTRACLDCRAHGLNTGAMAGDSRKMTALRPAAVTVHDHGYMSWQSRQVDLLEQRVIA